MVQVLLALFVSIVTTAYPEVDWDCVVARAVACTLTKGMTEEEVNEIIGPPTYGHVIIGKLGFISVYSQYGLRLDFGYDRLYSVHLLKHETDGSAKLRWFNDLPLPTTSPERPLR
jgi:hypothetical protein